jgi:hypothetical protein
MVVLRCIQTVLFTCVFGVNGGQELNNSRACIKHAIAKKKKKNFQISNAIPKKHNIIQIQSILANQIRKNRMLKSCFDTSRLHTNVSEKRETTEY